MQTFTLANGTRVLIRPIRPDDRYELQRGLKRLSEETIRRRFLASKPKFTSRELEYLTEVDGVDHIALVAVELHFPHRLVGVVRAIRLPGQPDTAEWAIVIADPYQGQGLGSRLMDAIGEAARAVGIRRFTATMLPDNEAVHRLLRRVTDVVERDEIHGGVREVVVALAA